MSCRRALYPFFMKFYRGIYTTSSIHFFVYFWTNEFWVWKWLPNCVFQRLKMALLIEQFLGIFEWFWCHGSVRVEERRENPLRSPKKMAGAARSRWVRPRGSGSTSAIAGRRRQAWTTGRVAKSLAKCPIIFRRQSWFSSLPNLSYGRN